MGKKSGTVNSLISFKANLHSYGFERLLNFANFSKFSVADQAAGPVGEPRNLKPMQLPLAVVFLMTYFYRAGGGCPPLDPLLTI